MKNNGKDSKQDKQANESRRAFLSKGIMLAGGIMLTPLWLEGCGGDNQGDGRSTKKKKSGGGGGSTDGSASTDGGTTAPEAGKYKCVDASELGSKQSLKVTVNYKGEHIDWTDPKLKKTGLAGDDGARAMGDALRPASPGTGLICGKTVRAVVESAGIRDILSKSLGSKNPANVAKATLGALLKLRLREEILKTRGIESRSQKAE